MPNYYRKFVPLTILIMVQLLSAGAGIYASTIDAVSGNAYDGSSLSITGRDFGEHSEAVQWLGGKTGLIETSPVGAPPPNENNWTFNSFGNNYVAADFVHSGLHSLKNDLVRNTAYAAAIRYGWISPIGYSQDIFISWWVRRVHAGEGQWKMFRVSYANDITDTATPQFKMFNWDNGSQFFVAAGPGTDATGASWTMPYPTLDNRWYRIDVEVHTASGHATNDGSYLVRLYDPDSGEAFRENAITNNMSFNDENDYYQWFLWQNYIGNELNDDPFQSQNTWTDDIYIQAGGWSRVELCDTPAWPGRTHCEIQPSAEWSDSSITFILNQGSFAAGDQAYLFVIDKNNNVSNGYPIVILGNSYSPNPPTGLQAE